MLQFNYTDKSTKLSGFIVSDDTKISFRKFPKWDVDPVETRISYIENLMKNPTCDTQSGSSKFMGWEFRFNNVKKYLVRTEYGLCMMYGFSIKQLRESANLNRLDKVIIAPKGW